MCCFHHMKDSETAAKERYRNSNSYNKFRLKYISDFWRTAYIARTWKIDK